jgi:hypothetical protein
MLRQSPLETARRWVRWQLVAELLWRRNPARYLLLKYEDFIREPRDAVEQILRFVGETSSSLPFAGKSAVRLAPTHSVSGNPSRFKTGTVERLGRYCEPIRGADSETQLVGQGEPRSH